MKKLHEWASEIDPWGCFMSSELSANFKEECGKIAPWHGYPARVANATVGQFKGLQKKLDVPDDTKMVDGWRAILAVWNEFGISGASDAERECISRLNGRGSIANACVRSLQRQDI